jgi:hypothetical protein
LTAELVTYGGQARRDFHQAGHLIGLFFMHGRALFHDLFACFVHPRDDTHGQPPGPSTHAPVIQAPHPLAFFYYQSLINYAQKCDSIEISGNSCYFLPMF